MKVRHKVEISATLELTQAEIGALDALAGYGTDTFLKVFYERMGKAYLQPYEAGLKSLFAKVRGCADGMEHLKQNAEAVLRGTHRAVKMERPLDEPWRAHVPEPQLPLPPGAKERTPSA